MNATLEYWDRPKRTDRLFQEYELQYMKKGIVVGIVGSREFDEPQKVGHVFDRLQLKDINFVVVSGGANKGADALAKKYALGRSVPYLEFTPEFEQPNKFTVQSDDCFGKSYGPDLYHKRNQQIAEYVDILIAFIPEEHIGDPDKSRGTKSTVKKARNQSNTKTIILK